MTEIDMALIQEAMDKRQLGLPNPRLPPSEAKTRMATVQVPLLPTSLQCSAVLCCAVMITQQEKPCGIASDASDSAVASPEGRGQ